MTMLHALVLGLIQGLTEFLPVSSSGHLILVPRMLGWDAHPLSFDVALHLGTTFAVLLYFRRDFVQLTACGVGDIVRHRLRWRSYSPFGRLALLIVLGSVPAVIVGGLFNSAIEERARAPWLIAALLAVFGVVMLAAERWARHQREMERLDPPRAVVVGVAQAVALVPGVSRSGITIAAGMFAGLARGTAARFSFLLAAPVVVAATIKELPNLRLAAEQGVSNIELAAGVLTSFAVGVATVHLLLRFLSTRSMAVFVWYRIAFAAFVLAALGLQ